MPCIIYIRVLEKGLLHFNPVAFAWNRQQDIVKRTKQKSWQKCEDIAVFLACPDAKLSAVRLLFYATPCVVHHICFYRNHRNLRFFYVWLMLIHVMKFRIKRAARKKTNSIILRLHLFQLKQFRSTAEITFFFAKRKNAETFSCVRTFRTIAPFRNGSISKRTYAAYQRKRQKVKFKYHARPADLWRHLGGFAETAVRNTRFVMSLLSLFI